MTKSSTHMPQLDGIRAIAVALVLMTHYTHFRWTLIGSRTGVLLFFILSGFLITGILLDIKEAMTGSASQSAFALRQFYCRRFLRIFPLFYATLLVTYIAGFPDVRIYLGWHAAYLSNFLFFWKQSYLGYAGHFWSLAVEEQFYLVWPAVILLAPKRMLLSIILSCVLAAPVTRSYFSFIVHNDFAPY